VHIEFKEELFTMSVQVENLEKNMAKLTIEVSAEEFEKAVQNAYLRSRGKITIPGFRKGKAPRVMIEKMLPHMEQVSSLKMQQTL
jgi:trigger factor